MTSIVHKDAITGELNIFISGEDMNDFKHLINRGLNTWDRAPARIKELGDLIIHGEITQNYQAQAASKPRPD